MDIDYSPTGREFVTGSYDRTVSSLFGQALSCTLTIPKTLMLWRGSRANTSFLTMFYSVGEDIPV